MPTKEELLIVADRLEGAAETLAMFVQRTKFSTPGLDEFWSAASVVAPELFSSVDTVFNILGKDIAHSLSTAGTTLLQTALHARAVRAIFVPDGSPAAVLSHELMAIATLLRLQEIA